MLHGLFVERGNPGDGFRRHGLVRAEFGEPLSRHGDGGFGAGQGGLHAGDEVRGGGHILPRGSLQHGPHGFVETAAIEMILHPVQRGGGVRLRPDFHHGAADAVAHPGGGLRQPGRRFAQVRGGPLPDNATGQHDSIPVPQIRGIGKRGGGIRLCPSLADNLQCALCHIPRGMGEGEFRRVPGISRGPFPDALRIRAVVLNVPGRHRFESRLRVLLHEEIDRGVAHIPERPREGVPAERGDGGGGVPLCPVFGELLREIEEWQSPAALHVSRRDDQRLEEVGGIRRDPLGRDHLHGHGVPFGHAGQGGEIGQRGVLQRVHPLQPAHDAGGNSELAFQLRRQRGELAGSGGGGTRIEGRDAPGGGGRRGQSAIDLPAALPPAAGESSGETGGAGEEKKGSATQVHG